MIDGVLSGYRLLWMFVFFDLPVTTRAQAGAATRFRTFLLDQGFEMSQYSVYTRLLSGKESAEAMTRAVEAALPEWGRIDILTVTDRQFERIVSFTGRHRGEAPKNPDQLALF